MTDDDTVCECSCTQYSKITKHGSTRCTNCKHRENDLMRWEDIIKGGR